MRRMHLNLHDLGVRQTKNPQTQQQHDEDSERERRERSKTLDLEVARGLGHVGLGPNIYN